MKAQKLFSTFALVACLFGANAALADISTTADASASSGAAALAMSGNSSSTVRGGNTYANGGIGADGCASSFGTPFLSFSQPTQHCDDGKDAALARILWQDGMISASTYQAVGLKAIGYVIVAPAVTVVAMPNYTGPWKKLSNKKQRAVAECRATFEGMRAAACASGS